MISSQLPWQALQPNLSPFPSAFNRSVVGEGELFSTLQPRLFNALANLENQPHLPLLMLRSQENKDALAAIARAWLSLSDTDVDAENGGWNYQPLADGSYDLRAATNEAATFTFQAGVRYAEWIESEQLFGTLRGVGDRLIPEPGLLHEANGGALVLSVRTLLAQPLMWLRLKRFLSQGAFEWLSPDERRPLSVSLPPLPLRVTLILCGDRDALAEFQESEPELMEDALYSEVEEQFRFHDEEDLALWGQWVRQLAFNHQLPELSNDIWPPLVNEGCRYTGDQSLLPLDPRWITRQLAAAFGYDGTLSSESLAAALEARQWREGYLSERMLEEISEEQVLIETEGEAIGQVNGLSVLDFPGHPRPWGEPSRITCVVHYGDGEVMDIERKAELGGNLHAKGMMIIQAYLISELELEQQLPFTASMVFEQSYSEVDGDSASLAELCALVSALSQQPLTQSVAVTGSVDQFGNVQPVGGLNEKIEGFFAVCSQRGLTGQQGVIIPQSNVRHLSLSNEVMEAVKAEQFSLWAVQSADEAIALLTGKPWRTESDNNDDLLSLIQERILRATQPETPPRRGWLRWLNWFNQN
ncbi:AAA family ATPase [Tatumella saanichensis]|uniref:AAA family ATPase n=1 Tax=Tatumella saanichensis TaxID=480813 RepID=UPI0004AD9D37|nr:Lon protease family protein [Tatumella saanichensis]